MTHSVVHSVRPLEARSRFFAVLNLAVLPLLVACAGDLDPGFSKGGSSGTASGGTMGSGGSMGTGGAGATGSGGNGVVACDAVKDVFIPKCVTGCHTPTGAFALRLDLSTDETAAKAIGMPQMYPCAADKTSSIINLAGPTSGSMILAISGDTCGAGTRMPFGTTAADGLTATEIACIKSYYMAKLK